MNQNDALLSGAKALIDAGEASGLKFRLLGGLAVRQSCPSAVRPPFERICSDMDCVVAAESGKVQAFLKKKGWIPEAEFNLYYGDRRLLFNSSGGAKLDVFLRVFSMCHDFDFSKRIPSSAYTVHPADLILTKLQIHEVNVKDLQDAACIFLDHELNDQDGAQGPDTVGIDASYIARLCSADWGLQHSLVSNLEKTRDWVERVSLTDEERAILRDRITRLIVRVQEHEKTLAWRSRAILGARLKWYRDVEEVER